MSKLHKCNECGAIQSTGWGSEFECLECGAVQAECLDHEKSEHIYEENYI